MKLLPLFFLLPGLIFAQGPDISKAASDKYEVTVPGQIDHYYILDRSKDMLTWKPAAISKTPTLSDSVAPFQEGYYRVRSVPSSTPLDLDGDGRTDWQEIQSSTGTCLAFNAARGLSSTHGRTFLPSEAHFDALAHRDNFPGAQNVREVKFLVTDVDTNPELYFINMNTYPHHYPFASGALPDFSSYSITQFNNETYFTNTNRKNLAGSLVSHENYVSPTGKRGLYTVEFWPTDPVQFQFVEIAYELIAHCAPFIEDLAYHAPSETQRVVLDQERHLYDASFVHTIDTNVLFASVDYQPMHQRSAFGKLTLASSSGTLSARDIVIFRNLPNDLTHVAGIITEVPQTPLSHVNLKARQNDTPNAYIKNASTHPDITPFIGQNVYYEVGPGSFTIRAASQAEVDAYFESIRPTTTSYPPRNLNFQTIIPLTSLRFNRTSSYGGKAANLAEIRRLFPGNVPVGGQAIPFYYYDEFMKHNDLYTMATTMMAEPEFQNNPDYRELQLGWFRDYIKKHAIMPQWMVDDFTDLQNSFPPEVTPRLRSSANAEDSVEFNGAGLYDSFTHHHDEGHISKSVKQVWASLWNYRAYEEREFYRIDHLTSAMGVLVHPNYSDEQANGVAVARNIFDPNWEGYYINVQIGEDLVTNPDAESIPEEMLAAALADGDPNQTYEIQYIRFSNQVPAGEKVLTQAQVLDLVAKMKAINVRFKSLYGSFDPDFAMEIEFKITSDGQLAIKQARPWVN